MTTFPELREALTKRKSIPPLGNMATLQERQQHVNAYAGSGMAIVVEATKAAPAMLAHIDAQAAEIERLREALIYAQHGFSEIHEAALDGLIGNCERDSEHHKDAARAALEQTGLDNVRAKQEPTA